MKIRTAVKGRGRCSS